MKPFLFTSAMLLLAGTGAFAQPATEGAPKTANPTNVDQAAIMRQATERAMQMMRMTPEQRQEMMRTAQEQALRLSFNQAGFRDLAVQDAVIAFVTVQEKSRGKVREAAAKLNSALGAQGAALDDAAVTALMNNYLAAVETAKIERETASRALDQEIGFSAKPRLMALLTTKGLIGDASYYTGDVLLTGSLTMGTLLTVR